MPLTAKAPYIVTFYPPRKVQRLIFAHAKRILQDGCYAFAKRTVPDVLVENGWSHPREVNLLDWAPILRTHIRALTRSPNAPGALVRIGEFAAHDPFIQARSITHLLDAAASLLASHLGDYARAVKLRDVSAEVQRAVEFARVKTNEEMGVLLRRAMCDPEVGGMLEESLLEVMRAHGV